MYLKGMYSCHGDKKFFKNIKNPAVTMFNSTANCKMDIKEDVLLFLPLGQSNSGADYQ